MKSNMPFYRGCYLNGDEQSIFLFGAQEKILAGIHLNAK
jgi:hypothetical protein